MPEQYPKISIVTPCFNQATFIEESIRSVIDQQYPNLEYIVMDGGSTDGTVDIIKKYEEHITYWISQKDNGIYDALHKGFQRCTGGIMGWLNSDDILHRRSLYSIAGIFNAGENIEWVQGYPTVIDVEGKIVYHRPARNSASSFYLKEYQADGIFIQQESTYWKRSLWEKAGSFISTKYKYAGDFELWMRFFQHASLNITDALIGGFRVRGKGQLSSDNYTTYVQECDAIVNEALVQLSSGAQQQIRQLQGLLKTKNRFPLLARLTGVNGSIANKMQGGKKINYDFAAAAFKIV
jgi:glycosyltransferase involved in cell wall biosynthesis